MHFIAGQGVGLGIGFIVGMFCPGVYRKIKSFLGSEKAKVKAEAVTLEEYIKSKL